MRRGFTLVEVMMAAGIIGLGVLGLIALLAGAARVQQTSSLTSESILVAKNSEALMRQSLSGISFNPNAPTADIPVSKRWYMVPKDERYGHLQLTGDIWPVAESTESTPFLMFERQVPRDPLGNVRGAGPIQPTHYRYAGGSAAAEFAGVAIPDFSHKDILPDSLVFRVRTINLPVASTTPAWAEVGANETFYSRPSVPAEWPSGNDPMGSERDFQAGSDTVYFYADGDPMKGPSAGFGADYITVDVKHYAGGNEPARITGFVFADIAGGGRMVDEIVIEQPYRYLNRKMISLQDRITFAEDETREDGRRPEFGFSVMYRTLAGGSSQAGMFMYGLQSPSRNAKWSPRETSSQLDNGESPIVEVGQGAAIPADLRLGFDSGTAGGNQTNLYYLEIDEPDLDWVVAPDQIVLVSWAGRVGGGADDAVRVIRREYLDSGMVRGYLDRGPRAGNQAILEVRSGGATNTEPVQVWVVRDVVESDEPDDNGTYSKWRLRPLRFVAFQLDG